MKILHICLGSHFTVGMTYQDNQLSDQNAADGHDVVVVSDCFQYEGHTLKELEEEDRVLSSGVRLVRMKYDFIFTSLISSKVRKVSRLKNFLEEYKPDVILFHGVAGYELLTVSRYKQKCPYVKLYVDSHEDYHNSGTFWFSLFFQYKVFNRFIVKSIRNNVDKFLYISRESMTFLKEVYGLRSNEIEFYPLGGNILPQELKLAYRNQVRSQLGLSDNDVLIVHTGKFSKGKKTVELLQSLASVDKKNLKLVLIGSIMDDVKYLLDSLINADDRVCFLGWLNSTELVKFLAAADFYFQPGTQSATMQNAICCGTPVALYPFKSHKPFIHGNGFFVENNSDCSNIFNNLAFHKYDLSEMSSASYQIAYDLLDYNKLAARLYF